MMEEVIVSPWSSDSEWQSVRQNLYASKDSRDYKKALRKLLIWKSRGRSLSRGLYCTELLLQVITKDAYFCDVDDILNENDLIHLYSMAIMKFVNLTADVLGKGPQKSMYFRASRLELPSWLIDMRHKISHDQDFPSLHSLRTAIEFLLKWLQTKYWNEDEHFSVVTPNLKMDVVDEFIAFLEFYMLSKIQTNTVFIEESLNNLRTKLSMPGVSNKECLRKIKELFLNKVWSSQLINIFVTRYLLQAQECKISKGRISKTDIAIWTVLINFLITSGLLTNLLQILVVQNSRIGALWVIELCRIFYMRRNHIDKLKNDDCMKLKTLNLDTDLVLRTALNAPHAFTMVFLKWLLRVQLKPLKANQQYNIMKLLSLYKGPIKINSKNNDHIFTVNDLVKRSQYPSQWSLAFGQINWRKIPFGTVL